jgi:hypothetical protein
MTSIDTCCGPQNVTLGGTGKEVGDRHPKVHSNVLIGCGASVLGNISIGMGAQVAAGSMVLKSVEPHTMVAGIPARPVGRVTGNPVEDLAQWRGDALYGEGPAGLVRMQGPEIETSNGAKMRAGGDADVPWDVQASRHDRPMDAHSGAAKPDLHVNGFSDMQKGAGESSGPELSGREVSAVMAQAEARNEQGKLKRGKGSSEDKETLGALVREGVEAAMSDEEAEAKWGSALPEPEFMI